MMTVARGGYSCEVTVPLGRASVKEVGATGSAPIEVTRSKTSEGVILPGFVHPAGAGHTAGEPRRARGRATGAEGLPSQGDYYCYGRDRVGARSDQRPRLGNYGRKAGL